MLKKVAILGPESTGKSSLTEELSAYFNAEYAPEFARSFLSGLGRPYNQNDLLHIAKKQQECIQKLKKNHDGFVFADTELIVLKIWSEFKYKKVHPWIITELKKQDFDLYLLTDIDLPWTEDPLREHPTQRQKLFTLYEKELNKHSFPYVLINGQGKERTLNAIRAIEQFFIGKQ